MKTHLSYALGLAVLAGKSAWLVGQAAAVPPAAPAVVGTATVVTTPSSVLRPSLDTLQHAVGGLRVEKWKGSGAAREETESNLGSIRLDLESTLPPMLAAGDGAPGSVSGILPISANVGALYDVLLRVTERAKVAAPEPQREELEKARAALESARRSLAEMLQGAATAEEERMAELQKALDARPVAPALVAAPAAVAPCPAPAKPKPKAKAKVSPAPAG